MYNVADSYLEVTAILTGALRSLSQSLEASTRTATHIVAPSHTLIQ
jgi:hypothetical protein